jgi:hypothetical protein
MKIVLIVLLAVFASVTCHADQVDDLLLTEVEAQHIPGIAVAW